MSTKPLFKDNTKDFLKATLSRGLRCSLVKAAHKSVFKNVPLFKHEIALRALSEEGNVVK